MESPQFRAQQLAEWLQVSQSVHWTQTALISALVSRVFLFVKVASSAAWTSVKIVIVSLNVIEFMLNAMQIVRAAQTAQKAAMIVNIRFASVQEPLTTYH